MKKYPFNFDTAPKAGTVVQYTKNISLTLKRTGTYTKANGQASVICEWQTEDGRICTSGLRGSGVYWQTIDEANEAAAQAAWKRTVAQ